jgi:hypothetical protein
VRAKRKKQSLKIENENIEIVQEMKYLGVVLDNKLDLKKMWK